MSSAVNQGERPGGIYASEIKYFTERLVVEWEKCAQKVRFTLKRTTLRFRGGGGKLDRKFWLNFKNNLLGNHCKSVCSSCMV